MKKTLFLLLGSLSISSYAVEPVSDTTKIVDADQVVVRTSNKETNKPWSTPSAISVVSPFKAQQRGIVNVKGLTTVVPNLFIPDYGSKMTTPVYLRGIGTRSSGQSVGMYVDNIPYMDKSTFDFDLMDIQRIEVLRGPQGTLYGRNAMGGIINVYTLSPFDYQGTKVQVGAGNYGFMNAKVSTYQKLSDKVAFSAGGYWDKVDGYFTNDYTNKKADGGWNAGGRVKFEWRITDRLTASLSTSYDHTDQNAFPYGLYDVNTGNIDDPRFNDRGTYLRNMSNNSLRLEYRTDKLLLTSNTGFQWLSDDMWMDQDFSDANIFTINQKQLQNSINQEITLKSITDNNYQWSVGVFGFYNAMKTNSLVTFKEDGVKNIIQANLPPFLNITSTEIPNPGHYFTPSFGLAAFHQSTLNNMFTDGLSLTVGLRLDYEKQYIHYQSYMAMSGTVKAPGMPRPMPFTQVADLNDGAQQDYLRLLPKFSLKYECSDEIMTYATVSRGYRTGGYNFQMFSEIMQDELNPMNKNKTPIDSVISYKPEMVWNYELGSRGEFFGGQLAVDVALFYMNVKDMQLTQFVQGGNGRILTNAGRGRSYGAEVAISANPVSTFFVDASYGYTHSKFFDYHVGGKNNIDYSGNFVPYVPRHTFSLGASYTFNLNGWLDALTLSAQYNGNGQIYWDEANEVSQPFYGLLNAKVGLRAGFAKLELWANNITSTHYGAFYFESFGSKFLQKGRPFTCGVNLMFNF